MKTKINKNEQYACGSTIYRNIPILISFRRGIYTHKNIQQTNITATLIKGKQLFILLVSIMAFYGCRNNNHKTSSMDVIKINESTTTPISLSTIVESSEIILLETAESCLLESIFGIEVTADYVFAHDRKNLFQFNRNGKFIRKIGESGKGPNEYIYINCFTIDEQTEHVFIGSLGKILCFDFDGNFVFEINKYKFFDYLKVVNGQLWDIHQGTVKSAKPPMAYQYQIDMYSLESGMLIDTFLIKTINVEAETFFTSPKVQYISETYENIYLYCPVLLHDAIVRDTLYTYENNSLAPSIKLDFSDLGTTEGSNKNVFITNIFRTQRFLFAEYSHERTNKTFLYDFSDHQKYHLNNGFNDDIYGTGEVSLIPLDLKTNHMYFVKNGYELEGTIDGVNENSNPVAFIVKLKE